MNLVDSVSREERINPPKRWFSNLCLEIWWKYNLKIARWELEKYEEFKKNDIAAQWRGLKVKLEEQLRKLGVDPDREPEDITKMFEVWLVGGFLVVFAFAILMFCLYRAALAGLIS